MEKGNPSLLGLGSSRKLGKITGFDLPSASNSKSQEIALKEQTLKETSLAMFEGSDPYQTASKKTLIVKKWNNKPIIDFSSFIKYEYLTDNEFLYCKRVGNPIEFIECVYSELVTKDKKKKGKTRPIKEYITISKNVTVKLIYNYDKKFT